MSTVAGELGWDRPLPPGVWLNIIQHLDVQDRYGLAPRVCRAWREHALSTCSTMQVVLRSGQAAAGFGLWLGANGHLLQHLEVTDIFFKHNVPAGGLRRFSPWQRVAMLQGLHAGGRPLPLLTDLTIQLDELTGGDAICLGLASMPALTRLHLDSNGSNIGVTGAQGLAPLTQLRQLLVPTQALGDQGLQIIGSSLTNLEHINLHNDGHVTDDGLPYLAGLTCLTSLDLQGSISITNHGMTDISSALPQLRQLNLSWSSAVDDWGFAKLSALTRLTSLNLEATRVRAESADALAALEQLGRSLLVLRLDTCEVGAAGLAAVAAALTQLQELGLSHNKALTSFGPLQALKQLSSLRTLDVSFPQKLQLPDWQLPALFELVQLQRLVAVRVLLPPPPPHQHDEDDWVMQYPPLPTPQEVALRAACLGSDGITFANSSGGGSGSSSNGRRSEEPPPAAAAEEGDVSSSSQQQQQEQQQQQKDGSLFWWAVLTRLSQMAQLTSLDFRQNMVKDREQVARLAVLLVRGLAAVAPQPVLQELQVSMLHSAEAVYTANLRAFHFEQARAEAAIGQAQLFALAIGVRDSINVQLLERCCAPKRGSAEDQQQQQQEWEQSWEAKCMRRRAALHAKLLYLQAVPEGSSRIGEPVANAIVTAAAAAVTADTPGMTVPDAMALLKLLVPSLRRLHVTSDPKHPEDPYLGKGVCTWEY